jgi:hypothetical protein
MHILTMESDLQDARMIQAAVLDCREHQFFAQELKDQLRLAGVAATTTAS